MVKINKNLSPPNSPPPATQKIQIVILAGGLGTRLRPLTDQIPKAMIPICGKPFIHHQLTWLSSCGIEDIILSIGYLGHLIEEFVEDGKKWNVKVRYTKEGPQLRGTAGALRLIDEHGFLNPKFLVTYGDSFLPIDFKAVWNFFYDRSEPALMTVLRNNEQWDKSNACFTGDHVTLYDKSTTLSKPDNMQFIDYGLSALSKELIQTEIPRQNHPNEKSDLADLFHRMSISNQLLGYEVKQRFYEIGSMSGIQDLEKYLLSTPL